MDNLTPGQRIAIERKAQGLNQGDLARMTGISQGSLSEIEGGATKLPAGDTLMRISKALRLHPNYVITGKKPKYFDHGFPMDDWEEELTKDERQLILEQIEFFKERKKAKKTKKQD